MLVRPLTRPLVRPLTRRVTEPGFGWSPRALFANGEQGAWYDPSDLSSMNTKHDGSGAVPGVGDPVGYIADKSGRGNHAKQTTDTARPTLQLASGRYYLQFDGVDDFLVTSAIDFTGTDKMTVWAGVRKESDAATGYAVNQNSISVGSWVLLAPVLAGVANVAANVVGSSNFISISHSIAEGVPYVHTLHFDRGAPFSTARINAGSETTVSTALGGMGVNSAVHIGQRSNGTSRFNGRIYSLLIRGAASTAAQIEAAERYAAAKTGVTLA